MDSSPPVTADASKQRDSRGTSASATAFLDLLRFTAANLVLLSHVFVVFFDNKKTYQGRGVAVIILFVLSGFLITRSLMYRAKKPGEHMPAFLADRVARIMTPFVPVLLAIALLNATVIHTNWSLDGLSTGFVALLGNLFLLFDYPVFQLLDIAHVDVWWRIRPYNTAEPFWTVAIEFWIYIAMSLLFFCAIKRERIRGGWIVLLALISVPVILWNAADGAGKALSLTWMVGGMAGFLVVFMGGDSAAARSRLLAWIIVVCGVASLSARVVKLGFDPYDLQTNFLMTVIFFGIFLRLNQATAAWRIPAALAKFGASYSYSLYLVHNTVLVIVFENTHSWPKPVAIAFGVVLAHLVALLVYHSFEKHHRAVGTYLRPIFARALLKSAAPVAQPQTVSPAAVAVEAKSELSHIESPTLESRA
ncbi:acyltransferase [Steroidobacter agaridevorans]|uniref:Acyltransferase n=1 Tax=Steroidobacter agaridevorans TaxID=2695856 RepID=A0A829YD66_9GAMM|nr:acyltransferase [Steroidobacter agaridevorans]GFE81227.1 acyltransferase [Steroidobacter agaridevorans]